MVTFYSGSSMPNPAMLGLITRNDEDNKNRLCYAGHSVAEAGLEPACN